MLSIPYVRMKIKKCQFQLLQNNEKNKFAKANATDLHDLEAQSSRSCKSVAFAFANLMFSLFCKSWIFLYFRSYVWDRQHENSSFDTFQRSPL